MPAVRDRNLWYGNLKEQLGILLLHGVSAVAPIPTPEDFGIDAIATLFRREGSRKLFAEDSFYVQIKSSSVRSIEYAGEQKVWLFGLELPFFIASVDSDSITLYPTHRLSSLYAERTSSDVIRLDLDAPEEFSPSLRAINIGKAAAKWTLTDVMDDDRMQEMYGVVKSHITIDKANILLRPTGRFSGIKWNTNEPASPHGFGMMANAHEPERFESVLKSLAPHIVTWVFSLLAANHFDEAIEVVTLFRKMERFGVPPGYLEELGIIQAMGEIQRQFGQQSTPSGEDAS